jgi:hypothetical protein
LHLLLVSSDVSLSPQHSVAYQSRDLNFHHHYLLHEEEEEEEEDLPKRQVKQSL